MTSNVGVQIGSAEDRSATSHRRAITHVPRHSTTHRLLPRPHPAPHRVLEDATADREIAVFRAHEHGAAQEEIARWALLGPAEVRTIVDGLRKEEDVADWPDGPDYLAVWPHFR
ncbi:hypothetical protein [Streptomyces mayteni]